MPIPIIFLLLTKGAGKTFLEEEEFSLLTGKERTSVTE
jgi:hypothetical protein